MTLMFRDQKYFDEDEKKFLDCVHLISNDLERICNQYDEAFNKYRLHFMPTYQVDLDIIQQLLHLVKDSIDNKYHTKY